MINNVVLVGRLARDVELKYTGNGTPVASITLAVEENFKDQNGEKKTSFINCTAWKKAAETIAQYMHKGDMLGVTGRLQQQTWEDQQGNKRSKLEVIVDGFQFLSSKQGQGQQQAQQPQQPAYQQQPQYQQPQQGEMDMSYNMPSDEDLPF